MLSGPTKLRNKVLTYLLMWNLSFRFEVHIEVSVPTWLHSAFISALPIALLPQDTWKVKLPQVADLGGMNPQALAQWLHGVLILLGQGQRW